MLRAVQIGPPNYFHPLPRESHRVQKQVPDWLGQMQIGLFRGENKQAANLNYFFSNNKYTE